MISRAGKTNFFAAHYDWVVAGIGALALLAAAAFFAMAIGEDPESAAQDSVQTLKLRKPAKTGVKDVDLADFQVATRLTKSPVTVAEVPEKAESFLASERRVRCTCGAVIPGDVKKFPKCPSCGAKQEEEKVVVLDADGDGLPDEWEKKHGFNVASAEDAQADADGDGFTNLEEFKAGTDPKNKEDHPDYLDSLRIVLPLKETSMPFVFTAANKIPRGWRCEFFDPNVKDDYGRMGRPVTAVVGEDIGKYGFNLLAYDKKDVKREIKGGKGMFKTVDVSEATVRRKKDGKTLKLVIGAKNAKPAAVDIQATLCYERGSSQNLDVTPGSEIVLSGTKYNIVSITAKGKGAQVVVENAATGGKRTIEALE